MMKTPTSTAALIGAILLFLGLAAFCVSLSFRAYAASPALVLPVAACLLLALVTPVSILAIRTQVRLHRVRLIELFAQLFELEKAGGANKIVSYEFVRGKYFVDLPPGTSGTGSDQVPRFPFRLQADWMLLLCAIPYILFSAFGIFVLLVPREFLGEHGLIGAWMKPALLAIGGLANKATADQAAIAQLHENVLLIAGLAFAGAYFFTLRLFLRAVVTFDLSPITFLRAFAHMVLSVILAIVLFRAMPSASDIGALFGQQGAPSDGSLALPWMVVAVAMGFVPETSLLYLLRKSGVVFKDTETDLAPYAKTIPLTLLDGIDYLISFRLEEANIFDVQNLSTYNPIMLHIESPFGIYQTMDWVSQAQLCTAVGPNRFLALRSLNIRTILDLKRVVLGKEPCKDAPAPPILMQAVADVLLLEVKGDKDLRRLLGRPDPAGLQQPQDGANPNAMPDREAALVHLVWMLCDDLHVRRLEQIWDQISQSLKGGPGPGSPPDPSGPTKPPSGPDQK